MAGWTPQQSSLSSTPQPTLRTPFHFQLLGRFSVYAIQPADLSNRRRHAFLTLCHKKTLVYFMPRLDIWDAAPASIIDLDCGYPRRLLEARYKKGPELGQGGFGSVHVVIDLEHGTELACKSIPKVLDIPNVTPKQKNRHIENIKREVAVLRKLRGTVRVIACTYHWADRTAIIGVTTVVPIHVQLNVVALEDVFEDEASVHLVMELCKGGELLHNLGKRHYSEGTVRPTTHHPKHSPVGKSKHHHHVRLRATCAEC